MHHLVCVDDCAHGPADVADRIRNSVKPLQGFGTKTVILLGRPKVAYFSWDTLRLCRLHLGWKILNMKLDIDFEIDPSISPAEFAGMNLKRYDIPTNLMKKVSDTSLQPIGSIDAEGLRLLLVQGLYLESIVPASICYLYHAPLSGGHLEEGALMRSLFQFVPGEYWKMHPGQLQKAKTVLEQSFKVLRNLLDTSIDSDEKSLIEEARGNFLQAEIAASSLSLIETIKGYPI